MRRPTTLFPAGLAAAAILLLPACGGGSSDESAASSTPTSSSAAESPESPADADVAAFCAESDAIFIQLESAFIASSSDPTAAPAFLQQAVDAFDQVQPPEELTADWETIRGGLESLRQTATTVDLATPEGQAEFGTAFGQLSTELAPAQANIEAYTTENCDSPSPAPTS